MREIVFDTETTGLDPYQGDRLVEIGCVEADQRLPDRAEFSPLPQSGARCAGRRLQVHGLSREFLMDKPVFAEVCDDFLDFRG
jgi:DNA polymerase-3 subunit epsilon